MISKITVVSILLPNVTEAGGKIAFYGLSCGFMHKPGLPIAGSSSRMECMCDGIM